MSLANYEGTMNQYTRQILCLHSPTVILSLLDVRLASGGKRLPRWRKVIVSPGYVYLLYLTVLFGYPVLSFDETLRDRRDASTGREIRGVIDSFDTKWIYVKIRWHDFTTFHWPFRYVKHTVYGNEPGHSIRQKISKSAKWTYVVFIGQRRNKDFNNKINTKQRISPSRPTAAHKQDQNTN